jgi:hypothetical protein
LEIQKYLEKTEVLMATSMDMVVFRNVAACSLVDIVRRFREVTELHGLVFNTPASYSGGPGFKSQPETGYPD